MDLDERKEKILKAIIQTYLETGEPVGSRTISKYSDLNLSSATIRNEMSDLEDLGYIIPVSYTHLPAASTARRSRPSSAAPSPSEGRRATSRRRCSGRPASGPARPKIHTGRAAFF